MTGIIKEDSGSYTEGGDPDFRHQITCSKCGMVYEMRYISESCRKVEGEGYLCMNCNSVLDLIEET